ncbi:MAG: hypothetical protein H7263_12975 [Candidatus Sericytochromatia bacterium]|nr:hypothetical protein [Candidatus Sericytochromatia bacterium]
MKIKISTKVNQDYKKVFSQFNEDLFVNLNPPGIPFKLNRFDGCKAGGVVNIELNLLGLKQEWITHITEDSEDLEEIFFVDESSKLPFFLSYWHHKHRILKQKNGSKIIDDITYRTPFLLLDYLCYPVMYFQFYYRKHIYKEVFK